MKLEQIMNFIKTGLHALIFFIFEITVFWYN